MKIANSLYVNNRIKRVTDLLTETFFQLHLLIVNINSYFLSLERVNYNNKNEWKIKENKMKLILHFTLSFGLNVYI